VANQRYQTDPNNDKIVPLQPAASPVQRFARPEAPAQVLGESESQQLAAALTGVQPTITGFLYHQQARQDSAAIDEATAMRTKTALNYKEAVKNGMPLSSNPFFIKAWKEQDGSVAADRYNSDLTIALATGPLAGSMDEGESEKLFNTFRTNWQDKNGITGQDPAYLDAFTRKANAYDTNARAHQASEIGNRKVADMMNNTYQEALGIFADATHNSLPPTVIADGLNHVANKLILLGIDPKKINSIILDAATTEALNTKSTTTPRLALDGVKTGSGFLGRTLEAKERMHTIEAQISAAQDAADRASWTKREHDRTAAIQDSSAAIYDYFSLKRQNGEPLNENDVAGQIAQVGHFDPGAAESLREVIKKANTEKFVDDGPTVNHLEVLDLENKLTTSDVLEATLATKIKPETARIYQALVKANTKDGEESFRQRMADKKLMNVREDPTFEKDLFGPIREAFSVAMGVELPPEKKAALDKALTIAKWAAQNYRDKNPDASIKDDQNFAFETKKNVLRGVLTGLDGAPVNMDKLTQNQVLPNPDTSKPDVYSQLTATASNVGSTQPFAKNKLEWQAMIQEYKAARMGNDPANPPENTSLGKIIEQYHLDVTDTDPEPSHRFSEFAKAQNIRFDQAPIPEQLTHPQPVPGKTPKASQQPQASTPPAPPPEQQLYGHDSKEPKVITEELISKIMGLNKHTPREVVVQALKNSGYK